MLLCSCSSTNKSLHGQRKTKLFNCLLISQKHYKRYKKSESATLFRISRKFLLPICNNIIMFTFSKISPFLVSMMSSFTWQLLTNYCVFAFYLKCYNIYLDTENSKYYQPAFKIDNMTRTIGWHFIWVISHALLFLQWLFVVFFFAYYRETYKEEKKKERPKSIPWLITTLRFMMKIFLHFFLLKPRVFKLFNFSSYQWSVCISFVKCISSIYLLICWVHGCIFDV